jgi:hypothetical protein
MTLKVSDPILLPRRRSADRVFLSAEWRDLLMLNYEVDPKLVAEYVPRGTHLDSFQGKTFVSLVGFRFLRTKLFGFTPLPFHTNFDEVNLRFYVKRREDGEDRRGVVFIREIVPRFAVAQLARLAYGENYACHPMRHKIRRDGDAVAAQYQWQVGGEWCGLRAETSGASAGAQEGSIEQFITEHYWGYSVQRDGGCVEYRVSHERWRVWRGTTAAFDGDAASLYGAELGRILLRPPDSAFIADGSPVLVFVGRRISASLTRAGSPQPPRDRKERADHILEKCRGEPYRRPPEFDRSGLNDCHSRICSETSAFSRSVVAASHRRRSSSSLASTNPARPVFFSGLSRYPMSISLLLNLGYITQNMAIGPNIQRTRIACSIIPCCSLSAGEVSCFIPVLFPVFNRCNPNALTIIKRGRIGRSQPFRALSRHGPLEVEVLS